VGDTALPQGAPLIPGSTQQGTTWAGMEEGGEGQEGAAVLEERAHLGEARHLDVPPGVLQHLQLALGLQQVVAPAARGREGGGVRAGAA
jgi:hypothetical protein